MADRHEDESALKRSEEQLRAAKAEKPRVDSMVAKLRRHLDENGFAERLYQQMMASRRET
jgi:hypothetical protein